MLCKPPFAVEIVKGDNVLSLHCSFPGFEMDMIDEEKPDYSKTHYNIFFVMCVMKN